QQVVQRRDLPPPRDLVGDLQPLGVLVEHRSDDMDEGLVAIEKTVAAGEQVAFEPAFALVLAQHFQYAAVAGEELVVSNTASRPFEIVSSGPNTRKLRGVAFTFTTSRRKRPSTCVSPMPRVPGAGTSTP